MKVRVQFVHSAHLGMKGLQTRPLGPGKGVTLMALGEWAGPGAVNQSRVHFTVSARDPAALSLSDEEFLKIQQPVSRNDWPHLKKTMSRFVLQDGIWCTTCRAHFITCVVQHTKRYESVRGTVAMLLDIKKKFKDHFKCSLLFV